MPFPERIIERIATPWVQGLLRVKLAIAPSFVISPSMAKFNPRDKNNECHDKQYRQNTRTDQQSLHFESFLWDLRPSRDQKESAPFLAPHFTAGGFIPAFARCCFCIAASLLVFTSPIRLPFICCSSELHLSPFEWRKIEKQLLQISFRPFSNDMLKQFLLSWLAHRQTID